MFGKPTKVLSDYISVLADLGRPAFLARHDTPVLVMLRQPEPVAETRDFHTSMISLDALKNAMRLENEKAEVFPLRKRRGGIFSDQVSVGRTRAADVTLPFKEVSKFHAYFRVTPDDPARMTLTDAGATNGTTVNGRSLQPLEAMLLENGATVCFGACECTYYTAEGFCEFVAGRLTSPIASATATATAKRS